MAESIANPQRGIGTWQLGSALCILGGVLLLIWAFGRGGRGGEIAFLFIGSITVLPTGIALVVSGLAEQFGIPGWRQLRWLPVAAIITTFLWWKSLIG